MSEVQNTRGKGLSDEMIARLLLAGDISELSEYERVLYYKKVCERVGLDPSTQPFSILELKKKKKGGGYEPRTILYLNAAGAQQLNRLHKVSHEMRDERISKNIYRIFYRASLPDGRFTDSAGVVSIQGLTGDDLSNALMRAETKSKRRSTVDLLGLAAFDGVGASIPVMETDTSPANKSDQPPPGDGERSAGKSGNNDVAENESGAGSIVFQFGWNKGKSIKRVYAEKGEKEITGAIAWAEQNNKFPEFIKDARAFLEKVEASEPVKEKINEPESIDDTDDLPF